MTEPLDPTELATAIRVARGPVAEPGAGAAPASPPGPAPLRISARDLWLGRARRLIRRLYRLRGIGYALRLVIGLGRLPRYLDQLQRVALAGEALANRQAVQADQTAARLAAQDQHLAMLQHEIGRRPDQAALVDAIETLHQTIRSASAAGGAALDAASADLYRAIETVQRALAADLAKTASETRAATEATVTAATARLAEELLALRRAGLARPATSSVVAAAAPAPAPLAADPGQYGEIYAGLEERFRGPAAEVAARQSAYLPLLASLPPGGLLDLGCGRGEFVALAAGSGRPAEGIDLSPVAVAEAQAHGLAVREAEALADLAARDPASLAVISGFHLIEHLEFGTLIRLLDEALRVLAPGGAIILETPNPATLPVGAHTFWLDPTHRHPIPPELARYLLEARGFRAVEIRPLNPSVALRQDHAEPLWNALDLLIHGPRDYAAIGYK